MVLLWPILVLLSCGVVAGGMRLRARHAIWLALVPAAIATWVASQWLGLDGGAISATAPWFGSLGAALDFQLNGWSGLMATLVTGVGAFVVVYASGYFDKEEDVGRFFFLLFLFMAAMVGLVLADNVILLFVFWELTSVTSFLLVGFHHEDPQARRRALQALLVTGAGGLALLAGLLLLGQAAGTWRLSELAAHAVLVQSSPDLGAMTALIIVGAMAKSAQMPLHFWLPGAMAAPTPVSAYLHSATMVKAGVYLLAVLSPVFAGYAPWHGALTIVGGVTFVAGAALGIVQTDLKRILAYTTIAVLGALTMLLGIGTDLALKSMVLFLVGHALYKAALFMVAGSVDHGTGTRDVRRLAGLRRVMPWTAAAGVLAAFSKAGFPPFLGFLGKEYVYKTGTALDALAPVLLGVALVGNALLFALALKAGWHPFWSRPNGQNPPTPGHEGPVALWAPPLILGALGLVLGLSPGWVAERIVAPAVAVVRGAPVEVSLSLWHGVNVPVLMSAATVLIGVVLYRQRWLLWRLQERVEALPGPGRGYERLLVGLVPLARAITRTFQSGYLPHYVWIVVASTTALLGWKLVRFGGWPAFAGDGVIEPLPLIVSVAISVAAIVAAVARVRMLVLAALGVVGLGVALLFLHFSAPDLAITQILVEALTIVLLLAVVHRLPEIQPESSPVKTLVRGGVALVFGACLALLALRATQVHALAPIAETLKAWSYPEAHGRNVVNVILVDFRALDTFGEIIVLAIAAIGVAALLRPATPAGKDGGS